MNTIDKISNIFILAVIITSCSVLPIKATETFISTITSKPASTSTNKVIAIPSTEPRTPVPRRPTPTAFFTFPIDRHDPESVIHAYFDALVRKDGIALASLEGRNNTNYSFDESVESVRVLEIKLISNSPSRRYRVLFDIQRKSQKDREVYSGQDQMNFDLSWDEKRDSWLIMDHGYG